MKVIVSYYPSTNKIHNIYSSIESARKDVKMCNLFSKNQEKLSIGEAELTDEEYQEYCNSEYDDCVKTSEHTKLGLKLLWQKEVRDKYG